MAPRKMKSEQELDGYVEFAALLLSKMLPKHQVKKAIRKRFSEEHPGEDLSPRTLETYISRGRQLLVEWSGKSKEEHFNDAAAFYLQMIQTGENDHVKLQARARLDSLYNLDGPLVHIHRGDKDSPIPITIQNVLAASKEADEVLAKAEQERQAETVKPPE